MHVGLDSAGESSPTRPDRASHDGRCCTKQAAAQKVPQQCSHLLHHAGEMRHNVLHRGMTPFNAKAACDEGLTCS